MANPPSTWENFDNEVKALNPTKTLDIYNDGSIITCETIIPIFNNITFSEIGYRCDILPTFLEYRHESGEIFYSTTNTENSYIKLNNISNVPSPSYISLRISTNALPGGLLSSDYFFIKFIFNLEVTGIASINNKFTIPAKLRIYNNRDTVIDKDINYPEYNIISCTGDGFKAKFNALNPTYIFNPLSDSPTITCECITPVCSERFSKPFADFTNTRLTITHFINPDLFLYIDNSLEVSYSTTNDESSYIILDPANYDVDAPNENIKNYLNIFIKSPNNCINTPEFDYTFVKTRFKINVIDLDIFTRTKSYLYTCFYLQHEDPLGTGAWTTDIGEPNLERPEFLPYNIKLRAYFLDACSFPTTRNFTANFSFNGIDEYYENGYYVLTIRPTNGIKFPTIDSDLSKIKSYISIDKLIYNNEIPNIIATIDNSNLKITIPYGDIYKNIKGTNAGDTISDINILVTIPYIFTNATINSPSVTGSMDFEVIDTSTKVISSLDNFSFDIMTNCPRLSNAQKRLIY